MIGISQHKLRIWSKLGMNFKFIDVLLDSVSKYVMIFSFDFCRTQLKAEQSERLKLMSLKDDFDKKENDWNKERSDIRGQIITLTEANVRSFLHKYKCSIKPSIDCLIFQEKLERQNLEFKNKISVLQQDLGSKQCFLIKSNRFDMCLSLFFCITFVGNSEAVQKDFVRLSQSLQVSTIVYRLIIIGVRIHIFKFFSNCF